MSPYDVIMDWTRIPAHPHGTHVAGIIAASINKTGVAGIAPNVKIMPINVFMYDIAYDFDIAKAIVYAADKGANVINMSLGSYGYSALQDDAVKYARGKGVVIIAAAGNNSTNARMYPAALPSVIAVAATDNKDKSAWFSNWGNHIDISAPGENIYSTLPASSYDYMSGTSMAAPVVSGVAALILSKNPFLSPDQVEDILAKSALDLWRKGWDEQFGYGRVDALKALQQTPAPMTAISSASTFTPTGTNKLSMSFTAQKGTTVSVYIEKTKGTTLKKLVNPKKWNGGKVTAAWDGKLDSGLYASSGSYTLVVKLTNGKETVYKTKTVKLTNKVKPTIKMGSSAVYSPESFNKLALSYDINQTTTIAARVYDSKNTYVKTVLYNKTVTAKRNKIEWDGTNSRGQKVKDGLYKLVVSGTGANKIKATNANVSIEVETVKPASQIDLLASPFKIDGTLKSALKVTLKEKVSITAYVATDKGAKVKRLIHNQTFNAGEALLKWDGKNDSGKYVAEGKYLYQTEVRDAAGNVRITKSKVFALEDRRKPVVSATKDFAYRKEGTASFTYTLNKPAAVSIQVLNGSKIVKTIESGKAKNTGANKFVWDGKDQAGNLLADGNYQYAITAADKYKNTHISTGNMIMALVPVEVTAPPIVNFYGGAYGGDVYYKLSQDASVAVEIYDSTNAKIRTIKAATRKAGLNHFNWDGIVDAGYYTYPEVEIYYYVIKAKNSLGNETAFKGKITKEEKPNWLKSHISFFTPSGDSWADAKLNLSIDVTEPTTMTLYAYDYYFYEKERNREVYNLAEGTNEISYRRDSLEVLFYVIEYKDQLGNEYIYEIDERDPKHHHEQKTEISP
ncbi:FlgD-like protein [Planomicrobium soli]|uniref:FlgD-like protein n=1 Tax=Planomicrobium soli TaxID=1176648 RepID=A0A2P8H3A8_9BACL|nr:FlgD-like protein [Planomicrobium soli]